MTPVRDILAKLIAFDTTSRHSNLALMHYIESLLAEVGIVSTLIPDSTGTKANLYATVGPQDRGGVMLSGHTDVVPVDGQHWTVPAFTLTESDNRYYGRGTTDMKGFVACAVSAALNASQQTLKTPLHLGLSYDEEIGCVGVHSLIELLQQAPVKPALCIVGEPTSLSVATKHKGKMSVLARCYGKAGHSALAPNAFNAIHLACDLVAILRTTQDVLRDACTETNLDAVPYTTVHVGRIHTDQALNIVPSLCEVYFEIRHTANDDPQAILNNIQQHCQPLIDVAKQQATEAAIEFDVWNAYPGLDTPANANVVSFVQSLLDEDTTTTTTSVAFGTEAGLFSEHVGIPTVVCGPGSMDQGHKPDEFVSIDQIKRCESMMNRLIQRLASTAL